MMALGIPLPGQFGSELLKGLDTGGGLFSRFMQPILQRESNLRQWQQHLDNLAIQKQAQSRLSSLLPYQIQAYQDAHMKAQPDYQVNLLRHYLNAFGGGSASPVEPSNQASYMPSIGALVDDSQIPALNENAISPFEAQNLTQEQGGFDLERIKNSPILRGFFKKQFGVDPAAPPGGALQGPAREAADLERLKKQEGEDSDVYQTALAINQAKKDAQQDLRDLRARTKAGLKPGETEFFDEQTGAPLGKNVPLTEKEREAEQGNILFNELFPYVYKGGSPFSGEESIRNLEKAAQNYKTDPRARQLFDDLLLADKLMAATMVNEASTLKAGKTNRTYAILKESLQSDDIPGRIKKLIKQYQIPASAQLNASMRYQKILSDARKKAVKLTPATQKLYYNPEMQAKYESQKEGGESETAPDLSALSDEELRRIAAGGK